MYAKLIYLFCLISIAYARLIARAFIPTNFTLIEIDSNSTNSCVDVNEEFFECGSCEPSCDDPSVSICAYDCQVNVCQCITGYFRNANGTCVTGSECGEAKTACHKDLFEAFSEGPPPPGLMVVSCIVDGLYESMQCHRSTGYCWCVDQETGEEINGTRKGPGEGPLSCEPMTDCQEELSEATKDGPPAPGQSVVQCSDDGNYESIQCHGGTGECWCADIYSGEEINGTRTMPEEGPPVCYMLAPDLTIDPNEVCFDTEELLECGHPCEPSCEDPSPSECGRSCSPACVCKSGYFRHSSGACVDVATCDEAKGPCHQEVFALAPRLKYGIGRAFVPTCNTEGSYSSMQCHGSTGFCWCVNTEDGTEIDDTRRGPGEENVNCDEL